MYHLQKYCLLFILANNSFAQNIIPNGGFETYSSLPTSQSQYYKCPPWSSVNDDLTLPHGSPDYFHINGMNNTQLPDVFATVYPHTGNAVMGIVGKANDNTPNYREYISVLMNTPMYVGATYSVSFWTTNGEPYHSSGASCNNLGVHFSLNPLSQELHEPIDVVPQLVAAGEVWSTDWIQHSFTIVATDPWNYFTLGVFAADNQLNYSVQSPTSNDQSAAYYFIDDISVEVIEYPFEITGNLTICEGESTTLTVSGMENAALSWIETSTPGQVIGSGQSIAVSPVETTNYSVYSNSDTATVTIVVIPTSSITVNSDTICEGNSSELTANGAETYIWSPSTGLSATTGNSVEASPTSTTTYTIIGTSLGCSASVQSLVVVKKAPDLQLTKASICLGGTALLNAQGADLYSWSPDVTFLDQNGANVSASPPDNTIYTVTGIDLQTMCGSSAQTTVELIEHLPVNINVNSTIVDAEYPVVSFFGEPDDADITWFFEDGFYAEGSFVEHSFPLEIEGVYNVMMIASLGGCIDTAYQSISVQSAGLFYIPNAFSPDGDEFNNDFCPVFSLGFDNTKYEMLIYNRWGELIFQSFDPAKGWDGTFMNEVCPTGNYVWKIIAGKKRNSEVKEYYGFVTLIK